MKRLVPLRCRRTVLLCCGAAWLPLCAVSAAPLPENCKPPAELASAIRSAPTARVYDAAGAWFASNGNLKCSVAAFEEAVRIEPGSAEAHYDLGVARVQMEQIPAAANEFRLALKAKPDMVQAHNSLGAVLTELGRPDEAKFEFESALKIEPGSVFALDRLAQLQAAGRHYKLAIQYWKQALALQPESPDITLSLAVAIYQDGDTKESIRILGELTKGHPDLKAAHFTLGSIFAQQSRMREAADEYAITFRLDPADYEALLAMVKALTSVSAFPEALAPAQEYVRRKPADPEGHLLLGSVYRGLGEYDKAEVELERAVAGNPENSQAQYELGFVLARNNKPKQALPHLEKAVALKPTDTAAMFQLAAVQRTLGDSKRAAEAAEEFRKGKQLEFKVSQLAARGIQANEFLQTGKPAQAAELYRQMLEIDPQNARTEYNLALALDAAKDTAGARQALETAARLDPRMAEPRAELGRLDLAAGNLASAEKWFKAALEADPQLVPARGNLAMIYALNGDSIQAKKLLQQALEDDPNYAQGRLNLGLLLAQEQNFVAAETELDKALRLAPTDLPTLSAMGKVEARLGKSAEGTTLLRKVVTLAPQSAAAHLDLAIALTGNYDLPGALAEAAMAVQLAPQSAAAHFNRGRILLDLGRDSEARPDFETACRLAPQMAEPRYFLAVIEKQAEHYAQAIGLLQTVVKLQPGNVTAWYSLGQSLEHESRTAEAIAAWKQAIALDPENSQALWNLARAVRPSDPAEAGRLTARYAAVQKKRQIADRAATLGNDAVVSMQAHEWQEAARQLKEAIEICGDCAVKADLHKNLGLLGCQIGDIDNGEKELLLAKASKPSDPDIERALTLIAQAKTQRAQSHPGKVR